MNGFENYYVNISTESRQWKTQMKYEAMLIVNDTYVYKINLLLNVHFVERSFHKLLLRFLPVGFLTFSTFLGSILGSSSSGRFLRT